VERLSKDLSKPIFQSLYRGDAPATLALLAGRLDVRMADGLTPLACAVTHDSDATEAVALALIRAGADVDAADEDGWTPLLLALEYQRITTACALLDAGADATRTAASKRKPHRFSAGELAAREYHHHERPQLIAKLVDAGVRFDDPGAAFWVDKNPELRQLIANLLAG
jgi:ankyrin repeat protein